MVKKLVQSNINTFIFRSIVMHLEGKRYIVICTVLLLCVTGDTGQGIRTWIKQILNQDMVFQHIKVIYPTAPARYCLVYA